MSKVIEGDTRTTSSRGFRVSRLKLLANRRVRDDRRRELGDRGDHQAVVAVAEVASRILVAAEVNVEPIAVAGEHDVPGLELVRLATVVEPDPLVDIAILAHYFVAALPLEDVLVRSWLRHKPAYACAPFTFTSAAETLEPDGDLRAPTEAEYHTAFSQARLVISSTEALRVGGKVALNGFLEGLSDPSFGARTVNPRPRRTKPSGVAPEPPARTPRPWGRGRPTHLRAHTGSAPLVPPLEGDRALVHGAAGHQRASPGNRFSGPCVRLATARDHRGTGSSSHPPRCQRGPGDCRWPRRHRAAMAQLRRNRTGGW